MSRMQRMQVRSYYSKRDEAESWPKVTLPRLKFMEYTVDGSYGDEVASKQVAPHRLLGEWRVP